MWSKKRVKNCLYVKAKKTKLDSNKQCLPVVQGAAVGVPIPDVDKGKEVLRNILAVVMKVIDDGFPKLGTVNGKLKQLYAQLHQKSLISIEKSLIMKPNSNHSRTSPQEVVKVL